MNVLGSAIKFYIVPTSVPTFTGNWGKPSFSSAIFVAMIAGVITSVIESIGDYYTCARIAGAHPPPAHAINRGIIYLCLTNG